MTWGDEPWAPDSLLAQLEKLPNPRRRQARVYPLAGILGMLILADPTWRLVEPLPVS